MGKVKAAVTDVIEAVNEIAGEAVWVNPPLEQSEPEGYSLPALDLAPIEEFLTGLHLAVNAIPEEERLAYRVLALHCESVISTYKSINQEV